MNIIVKNRKLKSLYTSDDYKFTISELMEEMKKNYGREISYEKLAKHCRTQKSYFSKVLHDSKTHLTPDQLFLVCRYLHLEEDEIRFLQLLLSRERANSHELRQFINGEIAEFRQTHLRSEKNLENISSSCTNKTLENLMPFFLDPELQVVHVCLSIERFSKDLRLLAKAIGISDDRAIQAVERLKKMDLVEIQNHRLKAKELAMHLSKDCSYFSIYRQLVRLKLLDRLEVAPADITYNFSVFFSATEEIRQKIHATFLGFLNNISKMVSDCEHPTNVYQMTFDLCPWTNPIPPDRNSKKMTEPS